MKKIKCSVTVWIDPHGYCRPLKEATRTIKGEVDFLAQSMVDYILKERARRMKIARSLRGGGATDRDLERAEHRRFIRAAARRFRARQGKWPKGYRP